MPFVILLIFFQIFALFSWPSKGFAERVKLSNGDQISGKISQISPTKVLIQTPYSGVLSLPVSSIIKIEKNDQTSWIFQKEGDQLYLVKTSHQVEKIDQQNAQKEDHQDPLKSADQLTDEHEEQKWVHQWFGYESNGFLRFSGNLQEGNTNTTDIAIDARLQTKINDKNRLTFITQYRFSEDEEEVNEDNRFFEAIYDYFFAPKWFLNNNIRFETDKEAALDLQTTVGLGLGHQFYDEKNLKLSTSLGITYLREEFEDSESIESMAGRWAVDYQQKIWAERARLFYNHSVLQSFEETDNFQLDARGGISLPIFGGWNIFTEIRYEFDNRPAQGSGSSDTGYLAGLGYEW